MSFKCRGGIDRSRIEVPVSAAYTYDGASRSICKSSMAEDSMTEEDDGPAHDGHWSELTIGWYSPL